MNAVEEKLMSDMPLPDTLRELNELARRAEADTIGLNAWITEAKGNAYQHGEYADAGQFARREMRLKHLCRLKQRIQEKRGEIGRTLKRAHAKQKNRFLVQVLRERTSKEVFQECVIIADQRYREWVDTQGGEPV